MKPHNKSVRGLVTAQLAIILAFIIGATVILIYEWRSAHHGGGGGGKSGSSEHHHKKKDKDKTPAAKN